MSKRMVKRLTGGSVIALLTLAVAASAAAFTSGAHSAGAPLTVGLVLPGPINDGGYNQGNFAGLGLARKLGAKTSYVENAGAPAAALDAMKNLAARNSLVLIAGGQFSDIAKAAAKSFPKTQFVVLDGVPSGPPVKNLHGYLVSEWQPAWVTGVVATRLTKSKKIGYLGGLDIPPTTNTGKGFAAGARSVDRSVRVLRTSIGSFDDVAKAKEAASAQIAGGADVLFTFLDAANPGVYSAIADSGKSVKVIVGVRIKSICKDSRFAGGWTLANYAKRVEVAVKDFKAGNLPAVKLLDMRTPNLEGLNLCPGTATPALSKLIATTTKKITSGAIKFKP
jgi:basic membrane protein A and related proteins